MSLLKRIRIKARSIVRNCYNDEKYIRVRLNEIAGYKPDLKNPKTLCEKLQWLKLNDRKKFYTDMVDKYKVKKIATDRGLSVIPLLGVWDKFDDIDFDKLPDQFVLKTNHTSGDYVVCTNKSAFDFKKAGKILTKSLKKDYYKTSGREWPYKNVERKIIAEEYIDSLGKPESVEYKVTCFNGKVVFITVCRGVPHSEYHLRKNDFYDTDWNFLPFITTFYHNSHIENKKPSFLKEMIQQAEKMAKDTYYLRVDFYDIDNKLYFGEATFYTWSGFMKFDPPEYDKKLGEQLIIPADKQ